MSVASSSKSSTSKSISEAAGERLYQNAQKQQKKLENAILQATVHSPKLELVASRSHYEEERDSGVPRYLKLYEDGLRRKEENQDRGSDNVQERMSVSSGSISSSSKSTSVAASERLYQQAQEKQNRLEDAILEANNIRPKLVLVAAKGRGLEKENSSVPRYLHLYENGKKKMESKAVPEKEEKLSKHYGKNSRCDRLYALSSLKQKEGKERREQIEKSKARPPPPVFKKIPLSQATRMYERSMQHLISKEMKLMDVAHENSQRYESLLVPQSGINS